MKTYIKEAIPVTHDEWLKQRSKGLGGSDAGAVMGLNPYKSAYTLWAEKTGLVSSYVPENEAIRLGNDLEEYVAKRFTEQTGKKVRRSKYCYQSKEYPFMRANVDREIVGENAVLECKTANPFKDADYSQDVIPPHYYCQCLHYIATRHLDRVYLAVLVFQKGFYIYVIDRKDPGVEEDIQALIQTENEFWTHVMSGEPPQVDGSDSTTNTLKQLHQSDETTALDLCDYDDKLDEIQELKDRQKHLKDRQKTLENEIKEALQNCDFGRSSIYNVSAKITVTNRFDSGAFKKENPKIYEAYKKESQTQTLRISKKKGHLKLMNTPANTAGLLQKKQQEAQAPTPVKQMTPQEIARVKMKNTIKASLPQFTSALPKAIKPERFQSMVLTAVNTNPKLMACDPLSVVASALQSAQLGLEPNTPLGQAYLIPYEERKMVNGVWQTVRTVCNFQVGYRGLITLAFRSGELQSLDAQEVYANDDFDFNYGLNMTLKHIPATHNRKQPGENPTHYYAVYKLKNGGQGMAVMTYEDVLEHAKKFSKTYSKKTGKFSGPWADNFDAMAKKTVLLKLMKYMPMSADSELARATTVDGAQFTGSMNDDKTLEIDFTPSSINFIEVESETTDQNADPETGEINE